MTRYGVDYSTKPISWSAFADALKANGYTFVGRYLSALSNFSKVIRTDELKVMKDKGIDVFFFYEEKADRALDGFEAGAADALESIQCLQALGVPKNTPVYFAVDIDTSGPAVKDYFNGVRSVMNLAQIGAYGGYQVIKWLFDNKMITYGCQCAAWSLIDPVTGKKSYNTTTGILTWDPRAQLRQRGPSKCVTVGGVKCNLEEAYTTYFGQYPKPREWKLLWHTPKSK